MVNREAVLALAAAGVVALATRITELSAPAALLPLLSVLVALRHYRGVETVVAQVPSRWVQQYCAKRRAQLAVAWVTLSITVGITLTTIAALGT